MVVNKKERSKELNLMREKNCIKEECPINRVKEKKEEVKISVVKQNGGNKCNDCINMVVIRSGNSDSILGLMNKVEQGKEIRVKNSQG